MGKHGKKDACVTCGGTGKVPVTGDGHDGGGTEEMTCPTCKGSGES